MRILSAVATLTLFTIIFTRAHGENVQRASIPVALLLACWWAVGPLLPLTIARPGLVAAAIWVAAMAASLLALSTVYGSTSSTSGIGLVTLPAAIAAAASVPTLLSLLASKGRPPKMGPPRGAG